MCNCCSDNYYPHNKIVPDSDGITTKQYGRINGWSCPLHPLQCIGWFFIVLFAVTHFAILVHYLPRAWISAGIIVPACGYIIHVVYHFLVLTLDPADSAVRRKGTFLRQIFDRTKHAHVIENSYCYICQTQVSSRSKHCSACNKCVSDFDHHCRWLNNCIGGRNYKLFLGCCISSMLTALVMFIIDFYLMIVYYTAREDVLGRSSMTTWTLFVPVCKEAYIIFVIVNGLLLLISILLMGHLLLFHCYLICKNMTTYEYIIHNRASASQTSIHSDVESAAGDIAPPPIGHLSSSQIVNVKEKTSYEMNTVENGTTYIKVVEDKHKDSVPVVEQNITTENITNVYEAPTSLQIDEKPPSSHKKKKKSKRRSSSKVDLIRNEDEEDGSLSSAQSQNSLPSVDEQEYIEMRNEKILRNFQSPVSGRESKSRPVPLTEETAYANIQETRIESVVSRPRSPSPKQSERISFANQQNDYVMRVREKHSSSSLSTIALQDHDEHGKPISPAHHPVLTPHREESFDSKGSSKTSVLSTRRVEVLSRSDIPEEADIGAEQKVASPSLILSAQLEQAAESKVKSPRESEVSLISLSQRNLRSPRKASISSGMTNITLASEKIGTLVSETELTRPVADEKKSEKKETDSVITDTATLIFEDEFVNDNEENINFLQQSIMVSEERQRSSKSPPNGVKADESLEPGVLSDAENKKMASYVEAFKRKRNSDQFSFGSDSAESDSGVPLATLNEDSDSYALSDTLKRVKKLSDAFPSASSEQDKSKKRTIPHPNFNKHESMSELSVVEYNKKKKLKKKRPSSSSTDSASKQLPPLRGRMPLPGVTEENYSDTDG